MRDHCGYKELALGNSWIRKIQAKGATGAEELRRERERQTETESDRDRDPC